MIKYMGLPWDPLLWSMETFVRHHEKIWLNNYKFYSIDGRYVDDTFCLFHTEMTPSFFDYQLTLGIQHL